MRLTKLDIFFLFLAFLSLTFTFIALTIPPQKIGLLLLKRTAESASKSELIGRIATQIQRTCLTWKDKRACYLRETFNWVRKHVRFRNDTLLENFLLLNNEPSYTIEHGNDCEGLAVLIASILKRLNVSNIYLLWGVKGENLAHVCVLVQLDDWTFRSFYCYSDFDYKWVERV